MSQQKEESPEHDVEITALMTFNSNDPMNALNDMAAMAGESTFSSNGGHSKHQNRPVVTGTLNSAGSSTSVNVTSGQQRDGNAGDGNHVIGHNETVESTLPQFRARD